MTRNVVDDAARVRALLRTWLPGDVTSVHGDATRPHGDAIDRHGAAVDRHDAAADLRGETAHVRPRPDAVDVHPLPGGVFSRAFAATLGGREYVVRLSTFEHAAEGFAKDDYAWQHFASASLPIPRVVTTGRLGDDAFAISKRAVGRTVDEVSPAERRALLPALLDTLDAIGWVDVRAARGYGAWDGAGVGGAASRRAYLEQIVETRPRASTVTGMPSSATPSWSATSTTRSTGGCSDSHRPARKPGRSSITTTTSRTC